MCPVESLPLCPQASGQLWPRSSSPLKAAWLDQVRADGSLSALSLLPGMGVCRITEPSQYIGFDGISHPLQGTCTYVMAQVCHPNMDLPFFKVSAKNEKLEGRSNTVYLRQVYIDVSSSLITLQKGNSVLVSRAGWPGSGAQMTTLVSPAPHRCPSSQDQRQPGQPACHQPDSGGQHHLEQHPHHGQPEDRSPDQV